MRRRRDRLPGIVVGAERAAALPGQLRRGLAAGMGELDAEAGAVRRDLARRGERARGGRLVVVASRGRGSHG